MGGVLKDTFFDVVADITAYNDNDIIDFVRELGSFDQYIMILLFFVQQTNYRMMWICHWWKKNPMSIIRAH